MLPSQFVPPSPSPAVSTILFSIFASLFLPCIEVLLNEEDELAKDPTSKVRKMIKTEHESRKTVTLVSTNKQKNPKNLVSKKIDKIDKHLWYLIKNKKEQK